MFFLRNLLCGGHSTAGFVGSCIPRRGALPFDLLFLPLFWHAFQAIHVFLLSRDCFHADIDSGTFAIFSEAFPSHRPFQPREGALFTAVTRNSLSFEVSFPLRPLFFRGTFVVPKPIPHPEILTLWTLRPEGLFFPPLQSTLSSKRDLSDTIDDSDPSLVDGPTSP